MATSTVQPVRYSDVLITGSIWREDSTLLFTKAVNDSGRKCAEETLSYTSLLATGRDSGVVFYIRFFTIATSMGQTEGRWRMNVNFAVRWRVALL